MKVEFVIPMSDAGFKYIFRTFPKFTSMLVSEIVKEIKKEEMEEAVLENIELLAKKYNERKKSTDLIYNVGNKKYLNIEANRSHKNWILKRNAAYIRKIANDKYETNFDFRDNITFIQLNFNSFNYKKEVINKFKYYNPKSKEELEYEIIYYHINLAMLKKMAYNKEEKETFLNKALRLIGSEKEEEMKEAAKGNKVLEGVYKRYMNEFLTNEGLGVYDIEILEQKMINTAEKYGIEKGETKKELEIAKNMLKLNIDIETISKSTNLSIEKIKKLKEKIK